jgi:hypothetical protein
MSDEGQTGTGVTQTSVRRQHKYNIYKVFYLYTGLSPSLFFFSSSAPGSSDSVSKSLHPDSRPRHPPVGHETCTAGEMGEPGNAEAVVPLDILRSTTSEPLGFSGVGRSHGNHANTTSCCVANVTNAARGTARRRQPQSLCLADRRRTHGRPG